MANLSGVRPAKLFEQRAELYSHNRVRTMGALLRYYLPSIAAAAVAAVAIGSGVGVLALAAASLTVSSGALAIKGARSLNRRSLAIEAFSQIEINDQAGITRAAQALHNLSLEDRRGHRRIMDGLQASPAVPRPLFAAVETARGKFSVSGGDSVARDFFAAGGDGSRFVETPKSGILDSDILKK